ncbi:MAG TPA: hypothetical protein VGP47_02650 [Parachlamydiaceae bacterium]|nr:hypothetical protein [Parachlamydiaceae bacterium]
MTKKIGIYLAGSIKKGHENPQESFWTEDDIACLQKSFSEYEVIFLNPAFRMDNLADQHSVFGRDMTQVFCSHVVFVDARDRRGLGVGAEMMWAKMNNIPVVTWSPKDSHYSKSKTTILAVEIKDFIHPFVHGLSDKIVETLEEGALWIEKILSNPSIEIKGIEHIHASMKYYQENQLPVDLPMREILSCDALNTRLVRPLAKTTLY